jgi:hypothetical protein
MEVEARPAEFSDCRFPAQVMYDSMLPGQGRDELLKGAGCDSVTFHEVLIRTDAKSFIQSSPG